MPAFGWGPAVSPSPRRAPAPAAPLPARSAPARRPDGLPLARWFCHVDDDNYVNVRALLRLLASYPHTQDIYLGKPSLDRPIQATERVSETKVVSVPATQACAAGVGGAAAPPQPGSGVWESHHAPPPTAAGPLLVCHRRGRLLHQPRAGPEDEPMGQVSALGHRWARPTWQGHHTEGPGLVHLPSSSGARAGWADPPPPTGH